MHVARFARSARHVSVDVNFGIIVSIILVVIILWVVTLIMFLQILSRHEEFMAMLALSNFCVVFRR